MPKSWVIIRDGFVLEHVFAEEEEQEAKRYLKHVQERYEHIFTMKLVDDDEVLRPMLETVTDPEYQVAIANARR